MTDLEQFAENFRQEVATRANAPDAEVPTTEAFTGLMIDELCEAGVLDDGYIAHHRSRGMEIHGYALANDHTAMSLIVAVHKQAVPPQTVTTDEIDTAVRRARTFFEQARKDLAGKLEESTPAFDLAMTIRERAAELSDLNIIVITDGRAVLRERPPSTENDLTTTIEIWDIVRLHQLASSGRPQEPIDIDFVEEFGGALPCLHSPIGKADYAAYLVIIPGSVLAAIYEKYGARLLERNVRAYLQARGKVNLGIRRTILDEPERFLAYNNGISATAAGVEIEPLPSGGFGMRSVTDLQIVNGGQTTASIHHLAKRDRERDKVDLDALFVQAKFTIVTPDKVDEVVPLISLYANSQNKVNAADFESNSAYHVAIEGLSRSVWAPALPGNPRMTHWFYERARGQYQDAVARQRTQAQKHDFKLVNPPRQRFTKTDLAKFENSWSQLPHIVSQGAQKNFREFTIGLGEGEPPHVDRTFFEHLVAKAILFKGTEQIYSRMNLGAYRANTVTYTVAFLSRVTQQRIDLDGLWSMQRMTPALEAMIEYTLPMVRDVLVDAPGNGNVTEWCKKSACWARVQSLDIHLSKAMREELADSPFEVSMHAIKVTEALRAAGRPMKKLDLIEAAGIQSKSWTKTIKNLIDQGRVRRTGKTRAAEYTLADEA